MFGCERLCNGVPDHMIAVLSDIHGNLEALQAVLADANYYGVDAIFCLGDLVDYGPDPIA